MRCRIQFIVQMFVIYTLVQWKEEYDDGIKCSAGGWLHSSCEVVDVIPLDYQWGDEP